MTPLLLILIMALIVALVHSILLKRNCAQTLSQTQIDLNHHFMLCSKYKQIAEEMQKDYEQKIILFETESERIREHYQAESRKVQEELHFTLQQAQNEVASLSIYASVAHSESELRDRLESSINQAEALEAEAVAFLAHTKTNAENDRREVLNNAKHIHTQAEALLFQAHKDAANIQQQAELHAKQVAAEAYEALNQKAYLEAATISIRNIIEGYGDRYIVPTHCLLDDLASDFGHLSAGESLRIARENTRRLVEDGLAASCEYVSGDRRDTAIKFVIDAFNGKVGAILSRLKHDNHGTLEQEIIDAFRIVNLNGEAFRNARILESYLNARLEELRWGTVVFELKRMEREEQRRIQEQIREEECARREIEKAKQDAAKEELLIKKSLEKAQADMLQASAAEAEKYEKEIEELRSQLAEAEAKTQRSISMAEQTRSGNVYIISNIGSFGDNVIKIGMTRRLEPLDRIKELGDASVPFDFDVHTMIRSDDAPTLERELHQEFEGFRINKVNYRKEFFRIPLHILRDYVSRKELEATFTMTAEAREYHETLAIERMSAEEKAKYLNHDVPNYIKGDE